MNYIIAADTDIGNVRETNQDSVAALVADTGSGPVAFGVVCDGMGGLAKGELASATLNAIFSLLMPQILCQEQICQVQRLFCRTLQKHGTLF